MIAARHIHVVLVTAPDLKIARRLARRLLRSRLAACVNLVPGLESHYRWQGRLQRSREVLLLIKTTRKRLAALERSVTADHPYDTPEIIAWPLGVGTRRYLDWVEDGVQPAMAAARTRSARRRSAAAR